MNSEAERVKDFIVLNIELNSRKDEYKFRRYYLMRYLRTHTNLGFDRIGKMFGKDHSTVVHALKRVEVLEPYEDYKRITSDLEEFFPMDGSNIIQIGNIKPVFIGECLISLENYYHNNK